MKAHPSLAVFAVIGFSALSFVSAAPVKADSTEKSPPEGLTAAEWTSIREAHEDWKHRFEENEDGTVSAINPGQSWRMEFDGRGFSVQPRDGGWQWGLELVTGTGTGSAATGIARENRLSYDRGNGITEWFVNDGRGLEQGWTLEKATGPLRLKVRGGLEAAVSAQTVSFGGRLTYGGLKAWDANGRTVRTWFEADGEGFAVHYDDSDAAYPITIDPIAQQAYLKASNTGLFDNFGNSVSVSGDTVVVGAYLESSNSTGVNSTPNDDGNANQSGAAYVFVRSGGNWSQQAYLKASNTGAFDNFGVSVSVSGDTLVVGADMEDSNTTGVDSDPDDDGTANNSGAAYVFTRSGGIWSLQAYLKASNSAAGDLFGRSVSVMGDTLVVGAIGEDSNATGVDGNQANNSTFTSGAAYVFTRSGGNWSQQAYLKASNTGANDQFGGSVAVSDDTVVVGAYFEDSNTTGVDSVPDDDGTANNSGAVYVFVRNGGNWSQQAYLKASNTGANDQFGRSVAVSGDTVVVGAPNEASNTTGVDSVPDDDGSAIDSGAAYVFVRSGGIWSQQAYLKASNTGAGDLFGNSVSVSGDIVVLGAPGESSNSTGVDSVPDDDGLADGSGAAYVFARSGVTWSQQAYLKASNLGGSDSFGSSVSVSGDTVVIGVPGEDSNTTGVDSVPDDDGSADNSGAAYLFTISSSPPTLRVIGKKTITTSKSRYSLKGSAADADGDLLRVEARDSRPTGRKTYRSARGTTRWSYRAPLRSGRNVVKIRSVDATGKQSRITRVTIQKR